MKKRTIIALALVIGIGASCKKTSKGKLDNTWTVISFETSSSNTDWDGTRTEASEGSELKVKNTYTNTPTGGLTSTATNEKDIVQHTKTYKKDGTWSAVFETQITFTDPGVAVYTGNERLESSGTWAFVGKEKAGDFKKNERIVENTLLTKYIETEIETPVGGSTVSSSETETNTYITGENTKILRIAESSRKELKLITDEDNTSTWTDGVDTHKSSSTSSGTWILAPVEKQNS